jgi:hypothetical protein
MPFFTSQIEIPMAAQLGYLNIQQTRTIDTLTLIFGHNQNYVFMPSNKIYRFAEALIVKMNDLFAGN